VAHVAAHRKGDFAEYEAAVGAGLATEGFGAEGG
jgi:hypothetical protein